MSSYYTIDELENLGIKKLGTGVLISRKVSIYGEKKIEIGNNVRIDDFCIISGKITIGNNVHIGAYTGLFGGNTGIDIHDFAGISGRCLVYAESEDYSGNFLTNPTIEEEYRNLSKGKVVFSKHSILGAGSIVLPNVIIGEGCSFGAMSLVSKSTESWGIYVGSPCKRVKDRSKNLLAIEKKYLSKHS